MAMLRTDLEFSMFPLAGSRPVRWRISDGLVPYQEAVDIMEREVAEIAEGGDELVWLLEHPPLYTAGTSANASRSGAAGSLSGVRDRARRGIYLSWPGPAGGLCHARSEAPAPGCARLSWLRWRR
jgi:lipoate-protein ligase B